MYIGSYEIDDVCIFYAQTQVFSTGVATDADADLPYRIYENETGTPILTGTMSLLDSGNTNGFYSEEITLSAANGFEQGKSYCIRIGATVSGVVGAVLRTLQVGAKVNVTRVAGTAQTAGDLATLVATVDTVVDAIKAKTDNLPSDPADASVIDGRFNTLDTSVADLPTNAELATALGTADDAVLAQVALVKAKTDNLPGDPADASDIATAFGTIATVIDAIKDTTDKLDDTLEDDGGTYRFTANALEEAPSGGGSAPTADENAAALLKYDWDGLTGEADFSVLNALRFLRCKWSVAATTLTVYKEDGIATAWTGTVSVNASADPITGNTPA